MSEQKRYKASWNEMESINGIHLEMIALASARGHNVFYSLDPGSAKYLYEENYL